MILRHLALSLLFLVAAPSEAQAPCPEVSEDLNMAVLDFWPVHSISGMAVSRRHEGLIWFHNHSPDRPRLYGITTEGSWVVTLRVGGVEAVDWQDAAMHDGTLYVLDAGAGAIVAVDEPHDLPERGAIASPSHSDREPPHVREAGRRMTYRGAPGTFETLLVDPEGNLFVVSREGGIGVVHRLGRFRPGRTVRAREVSRVIMGDITGGDVSPSGRVLLRSRTEARVFQSVSTLRGRGCPLLLQPERMGRAAAFGDDATWFTASEGRTGLHRYRF